MAGGQVIIDSHLGALEARKVANVDIGALALQMLREALGSLLCRVLRYKVRVVSQDYRAGPLGAFPGDEVEVGR